MKALSLVDLLAMLDSFELTEGNMKEVNVSSFVELWQGSTCTCCGGNPTP